MNIVARSAALAVICGIRLSVIIIIILMPVKISLHENVGKVGVDLHLHYS